ncbi:YjfB family protein [Desulfotruncus alcoholivorax]|uniref:YjfB family protein n=1 Tax=Desulfotruncus alcoholivorax TaxID=265477 RepID=UPI00041CA810|nr:YjfB family protein [Desulfotruncus alcoholivorax]
MDMAALPMAKILGQLQQQVSLAVMKIVMDAAEQTATRWSRCWTRRRRGWLRPLLPGLPENRLPELTGKLRGAFGLVVSAHEGGSAGKSLEYAQFVLVLGYRRWREELERCLRPFVAS